MDIADGGNPMAEIALALSMAFFSILVLALVSMRAGDGAESADVAVAAAAPGPAPARQTILVHWQGRLLDISLRPITVANLPDGPLVLAVAPDLPVAEAVALRQRFAGRDLTVAALDARWLDRLKESTR